MLLKGRGAGWVTSRNPVRWVGHPVPKQAVTHRNWAFSGLDNDPPLEVWWLGQSKARRSAWSRCWLAGFSGLSLPLPSRSLQWEGSSIASPQASHCRGPF